MSKGEDTRQFIIQKSAPVFNRLGFRGAALSDLMVATGMEKGGIYRHFESKEELACAAFEYAWRASTEAKFGALRDLPTAISKIEHFIKNFAILRSPIGGGCPVYNNAVENDDGNAALRRLAQNAFDSWIAELAGFIEAAKKEGALKKDTDAQKFATFLLTSLEGALVAKNLTGRSQLMNDVSLELAQYLKSKRTSD